MRAVALLLHAQLRQHGKSWLALAVLAALAGGRRPHGDRDIALGAATLRGLGAGTGDQVRVTVHDP